MQVGDPFTQAADQRGLPDRGWTGQHDDAPAAWPVGSAPDVVAVTVRSPVGAQRLSLIQEKSNFSSRALR